MADCDDHLACAIREVTRRGGAAIWNDPGRLRSRLHYEMGRLHNEIGTVSSAENALLDVLVIATLQGIPGMLQRHDDVEEQLLVLADSVGPQLAADAVSAWTRALAEPEHTALTLIDRLRPPPPVGMNA